MPKVITSEEAREKGATKDTGRKFRAKKKHVAKKRSELESIKELLADIKQSNEKLLSLPATDNNFLELSKQLEETNRQMHELIVMNQQMIDMQLSRQNEEYDFDMAKGSDGKIQIKARITNRTVN